MALDLNPSALPQGILRYEDVVNAPKPTKEEMGQQEFLTLFTTQLKMQNPLDPVKNEAFVAQLAQFSSLEANISMKQSLDTMVTAMGSDRVMASASLIGKSVAVPDAAVQVTNGVGGQGVIPLPTGAAGLQVNVTDASGNVVRELIYPAQPVGDFSVNWDGTDSAGNMVPNGNYRFSAAGVVGGQTVGLSVNAVAKVMAVRTNSADNSLLLEFEGGKTLPLAEVTRIGM
ncbi:MAG: FlgD immunoglobulin-like domain containing protein [Burkholderiaceae bacterium]|nr:FlgD immunoglobulin-like domain containing protein [Burkholderiaceae bacterium]